ncbi:MAG TPA: LEA type 2 family protein [Burkholderiales bacterium]|jgi:LEA14-like dessication related protein|nr:LEA type 2 family protein [Burkholderiales bacterium]
MSPLPYHRVAAFALLCACLASGCQSLEDILQTAPKPTARIVGTELKNLSVEKIDLIFNVEVANPYAVDLPLVDLTYDVASGGTSLLKGNIKPSGTVQAHGTSLIQVPARIPFASLFKTLKGVKPGSVVPYKADLTLGVDAPVVGMLTLPLSKSGDLPVPAAPDVALSSFEIGKFGLDETKATAKLQVKNTNTFALNLSKLNLELALGANKIASTSLANSAKIAPGQTVDVNVPLSFSPRSFGQTVINLLRGNKSAYSLIGSVEAGTPYGPLALPFNRNGNTTITK